MGIIIRDIFIAYRSKNIVFDARQPPCMVGHTKSVVGYLALPADKTKLTRFVTDRALAGCQGHKTPKHAVDGPSGAFFYSNKQRSWTHLTLPPDELEHKLKP